MESDEEVQVRLAERTLSPGAHNTRYQAMTSSTLGSAIGSQGTVDEERVVSACAPHARLPCSHCSSLLDSRWKFSCSSHSGRASPRSFATLIVDSPTVVLPGASARPTRCSRFRERRPPRPALASPLGSWRWTALNSPLSAGMSRLARARTIATRVASGARWSNQCLPRAPAQCCPLRRR